MGNFTGKDVDINVFILGLKGAGKTHLLYKAILDDNLINDIKKNTATEEFIKKNSLNERFVPFLPTIGFNREKYTGVLDFSCWDIGGCNIYGGENAGEFFANGREQGFKLFVHNVEV